MKKLIFLLLITVGIISCKKENKKPVAKVTELLLTKIVYARNPKDTLEIDTFIYNVNNKVAKWVVNSNSYRTIDTSSFTYDIAENLIKLDHIEIVPGQMTRTRYILNFNYYNNVPYEALSPSADSSIIINYNTSNGKVIKTTFPMSNNYDSIIYIGNNIKSTLYSIGNNALQASATYTYGVQKDPYYSCGSKWYFDVLGALPPAGQNNIITENSFGRIYNFTYTYNSDGYPLTQTFIEKNTNIGGTNYYSYRSGK